MNTSSGPAGSPMPTVGTISIAERSVLPCTEVWNPLYAGLGFPVRANTPPYTGYAFSLHGGFDVPTRRFGVPYTEQEGIWRIDGIIDVRGGL